MPGSSRRPLANAAGIDDSCPLRNPYRTEYRQALNSLLEGPGYGERTVQDLRPRRQLRRLLQLVRRGNHGQRPQPPLPWPAQETSSRTTDTSTSARTQERHHIRSAAALRVVPDLAVHGVKIMRKMATCWTCGRTFWVWRLRERNFCSGKCRVRHHRSAYRRPWSSMSAGVLP